MTNQNKWVDLSILGLCTVALSGVILRSKIVFALPFINFNHFLEGHSHFTLGGWATLVLLVLMVYELLPPQFSKRSVYQWLLGGIAICAWSMLIAFLSGGYSLISTMLSILFIFLTYGFGWIFIRDILKTKLATTVMLLAILSIVCLILSSSGPIIMIFISFKRALNPILYKDALYTYLHFQYNGFFSLAIFALLFNSIGQNINSRVKIHIYRFTVVLCASIIPSLFLSYLWHEPDKLFRIIALVGSLLVLLSFYLFILSARSLKSAYNNERQVIRLLVLFSMGSFMLKSFLQCLTIFPKIGNAIFGNRPIIMGFLHLVFLGFVSLFTLAFVAKEGLLDCARKFTQVALIVFALAVLFNEVLLFTQGLATMFIGGSTIFPWLLWVAGICLFAGTLLIAIARIQTSRLI